MERYQDIPTYHAKSRADWRNWLQLNHQSQKSVWLIIYKKSSGIPSINYSQAVDEALCFGWIDSKPNKRDEESYYQFFAKRNPKSNWSKVNKDKIAVLLKQGLVAQAGLDAIEIAKQKGTWQALDEVEQMVIPTDMQVLFNSNLTAFTHWENFSRSSKRAILEWILNAKRPETRQKRVAETVQLAAQNIKANHPKQ